LLQPFLTGRAGLAGADQAANPGRVPYFKTSDVGTDSGDMANNLVAWDNRKHRVLPLITGGMQVRMANPTIGDFYLHVVRANIAAVECKRCEWLISRRGGEAGACEHDFLVLN
jgi:hypothetical protein